MLVIHTAGNNYYKLRLSDDRYVIRGSMKAGWVVMEGRVRIWGSGLDTTGLRDRAGGITHRMGKIIEF